MNNKGDLEKQKLQVEIEEIKLKIESERSKIESETKSTKWERVKILATIFLTYTSVAIGIVTIWTKSATFLRQQGRQQDFVLNQELIKLVDDLKSDNPVIQEDAVILLSFFKEGAVPILLKNLERTQDPSATIESLRLIKENLIKEKKKVKDKEVKEVLDPLLKSASKIFSVSEIADDEVSPDFSISNYISALGELGREKKKEVEDLLNDLKNRVEEGRITLSDVDKDIITEGIKKSLEKIKKGQS